MMSTDKEKPMTSEQTSSVYDDNELIDLRLKCVTLLLSCPGKFNSKACPFRALRKESVVTRVHWLKNQEAPRLRRLLDMHARCPREEA
jgi:hypothetical protein